MRGRVFNNSLSLTTPNSTSPQAQLASLLIISFHLLTFSQAIKENTAQIWGTKEYVFSEHVQRW